jgi:NADH:ubiquinone oxidoreductase subunit 4 (subunit M)
MRPVEILTVAPLATLTVVLGIFPGLLLDLVAGPVRSVLAAVDPALGAGLGR